MLRSMQRVRNLIFRVVFAIVILLIAIAGVAVLYSNYAGSSVASSVIPVPSDSEHLSKETITQEIYDVQLDVYTTSTSFEETRVWFNKYIRMSNDMASSDEELHSFSIDRPLRLPVEYILFIVAGNLTRINPNQTYTYDEMPDCFSVEVFNQNSFSQTDYRRYVQTTHVAEENSVFFVVQTCWPNW